MFTKGTQPVSVQIGILILIFVMAMSGAMPVSVMAMPDARMDSPGALDTSFDSDGLVSTIVGVSDSHGQAMAIQPDGKIIVAGDAARNIIGGSNIDFALVRYNGDGSLDTSFDTDGKVTTDFGNYQDSANAIALQPDGKIVVAGYHYNEAEDECVLARYNSDGSLDTSFDVDGKVTINLRSGYFEELNAIAVQPDGKIIVVGDKQINTGNHDIVVIRYNPDGSLDTTFDGDGIVITAIGSKSEYGRSISIQPDGKIVIGGTTSNGLDMDFALVRYNNDGSLDTSFNTDGIATLDFGRESGGNIALQPDGKILIAGDSLGDSGFFLLAARYKPDGTLDPSFDTDGLVTTVIGAGSFGIRDIALDGNSKIILAGTVAFGTNPTGSDFVIARL